MERDPRAAEYGPSKPLLYFSSTKLRITEKRSAGLGRPSRFFYFPFQRSAVGRKVGLVSLFSLPFLFPFFFFAFGSRSAGLRFLDRHLIYFRPDRGLSISNCLLFVGNFLSVTFGIVKVSGKPPCVESDPFVHSRELHNGSVERHAPTFKCRAIAYPGRANIDFVLRIYPEI